MAEMETAEEFARRMVEAVEDDHLLSREALPVFIASELEADRKAVALRAKLEALDDLVPLLAFTGRNRAILDLLRAKYQDKP